MSLLNYFTSRTILLALASLVAIVSAFSLENDDQQPLHAHMKSNFSVGFSLQSFYGAAAVIFEGVDGTLETYTRIYEPGYLYQQVMTKLSLQSSQHVAPPYDNDGEYWADQPRKGARMALKTLGLPASYEVGILAQVIQHLRSQLEFDFGISISEAVFTSSHLLALYQDDLEDAAENGGIKYVAPRWQFKPILWETAAAYAGHGLGMCKHWRDEDRCREENTQLPETTVLAVHYSHNALTVSLAEIQTAFDTWEPDYRRVENFALGSNAIPGYPSSNEYWANVKETLLQIMDKYPLFARPKTVMVTGDMAYGHFMKFLKETLYDYLGELPPILSSDAMAVVAKGAAEIMRRN
ncbi:hypothetical protein BDZ45DRAFT_732963 [Acephala macrosclerotiorum]|nr:hypothetical protein BDZ45DRAFT_732963 [Acephala macrosclerotiorum]